MHEEEMNKRGFFIDTIKSLHLVIVGYKENILLCAFQ